MCHRWKLFLSVVAGLTLACVSMITALASGLNAPADANATSSALLISDVRVTSITDTSAAVSWTTNVPATGQVTYPGGTVQDVHPDGSTVNTTHVVTLTGLSPNTQYSYTVSSTANGNTATTGPSQFTTGPTLASVSTYTTLFTAVSSGANPSPIPNTLLFFTVHVAGTGGQSEAYAGMTDANGQFSLVQPLRSQDLQTYLSGVNGTLSVTAESPSGGKATASFALSNGSLQGLGTVVLPSVFTSYVPLVVKQSTILIGW